MQESCSAEPIKQLPLLTTPPPQSISKPNSFLDVFNLADLCWGGGLQLELPFSRPHPVLHSAYVPGTRLRMCPSGCWDNPVRCRKKVVPSYLIKGKKWRCINIKPMAWHEYPHSFPVPGYHGSRFPHTFSNFNSLWHAVVCICQIAEMIALGSMAIKRQKLNHNWWLRWRCSNMLSFQFGGPLSLSPSFFNGSIFLFSLGSSLVHANE